MRQHFRGAKEEPMTYFEEGDWLLKTSPGEVACSRKAHLNAVNLKTKMN